MKFMRLLSKLVLALSLIATNFSVSPAEAKSSFIEGSDPAAVMFDPTKVNRIELTMSNEDFDSLKSPNVSWNFEGDWRSSKMTAYINNEIYGPYQVGVHLKGAWGSWRDVTGKAGFKIKMDAFVPKQTLLGVSRLTLNNMVQDGSYIHEALSYKLMRSAGVPAPRTGYAIVNLNGIDYGLHLNVETVNKQMLSRWGVTSQHLYKGGVPTFPDFTPGREVEYNLQSGDPADTSDLTKFIQVNQLNGDEWWGNMLQIADMDEILKVWALELYVQHWDGYVVNLNNYFINFDKSGKASMYSWGTDQTWGGYLDFFNYRGLMPSKCLGSPQCSEAYLQVLARIASIAKSTNLYLYGLAVQNGISEAIQADPFRPGGLDNVQSAQDAAFNQVTWALSNLQNLVVPWDTTANTAIINGKSYDPYMRIYLPVNTKYATVKLLPNQADATSELNTFALAPGANDALMTVKSADGNHINDVSLDIYVLSQRNSSIPLTYLGKNIQLTKESLGFVTGLAKKLSLSRNISLTIEVSLYSASKLNKQRIESLLAKLRDSGVSKVSYAIKLTSQKQNRLIVKAKFQN